MPVEQLAHLRLGEEEAEVLVPLAVHGHADAVQQRAEDDDDLGVVARHPVVAHERRLDAVLRQLAQELERDVRDDLDVHPRVVVDLHAHDGVDVRDVPPRLQLLVVVDALDQRAQLAVAAHRHVDPHLLDRLGGRQPRLALAPPPRPAARSAPRSPCRAPRAKSTPCAPASEPSARASSGAAAGALAVSWKYAVVSVAAANGMVRLCATSEPSHVSRKSGSGEKIEPDHA